MTVPTAGAAGHARRLVSFLCKLPVLLAGVFVVFYLTSPSHVLYVVGIVLWWLAVEFVYLHLVDRWGRGRGDIVVVAVGTAFIALAQAYALVGR